MFMIYLLNIGIFIARLFMCPNTLHNVYFILRKDTSVVTKNVNLGENSGSHDDEYEGGSLLGCCTV